MMRNRIPIFISLLLSLMITVSSAQESALTTTDMKADPGMVDPGETVIISCRVSHPEGPASIKRVAATGFGEKRNTTYPMLYDDGSHGDAVAGDGIYSLGIQAPGTASEVRIVFVAVDRDGNEIESEPVIITVK